MAIALRFGCWLLSVNDAADGHLGIRHDADLLMHTINRGLCYLCVLYACALTPDINPRNPQQVLLGPRGM
jgi:hypothetical protein